MAGDSRISWTTGRNERELLARRRQEAEIRLARERARSSRRALMGFVVLAALAGAGIHYGFTSFVAGPAEERLSPAQIAARQFIQSRTADVRFNALDGSICRELKFNNDTGRFLDNRVTRCDRFDENVVSPPVVPQGPTDRALAIREGFQKP
jgi:hypothetical protein